MEPSTEDGFAREKCTKCGWVHYHNSRPTVSALIIRAGKVLLCNRAADPFRGKWDLPGGFLEETESPEGGLKREILEELGIEVAATKLIAVLGPTPYPFGGQELYNCDIYYEVRITSGEPKAMSASDVSAIDWFDPDNLPPMAFETNVKAIETWKKLLKTMPDRRYS